MRENKRILGLILARGGSKSIPHKNIKKLNGKPLIAYVIEEMKKSKYLDNIYVSTDDRKIAKTAIIYGANVIERPKELADGSKPIESIQHFISNVKGNIIILVNACCPLTKKRDIDEVIRMMLDIGTDSVTTLVEDFSSHPTKVCKLKGNMIIPISDQFKTGERQKQDKIYKRNTAIYAMKRKLIEQGKIFGPNLKGYIMPKERSLDINDLFDWKIAEFLIKEREIKK